jgi:hypothetical protein
MAKSAAETALATLDGQIADLQRARTLLVAAMHDAPEPETPKKRGRKKKAPGLPSNDTGE